ncbi:MAG: hypothetical protein ACREOZ_03425, partial [Gloeomargaritales cyanobacterium]
HLGFCETTLQNLDFAILASCSASLFILMYTVAGAPLYKFFGSQLLRICTCKTIFELDKNAI